MTLEVLQKEMIAAMKDRNKLRKDTISSLIDSVKKATITNKGRIEITEELVDKVILKEQKTMQEMIDTCPADRVKTLEEYNQKMAVIKEFVPQMMSEDEVRQTINHLIATVDGVEYSNKGSIMKVVSPVLKGKADMKMVNQIVSEICSKVK